MNYVTQEQENKLFNLGYTIDSIFVDSDITVYEAISWFRKQEVYGYIHSSVASNYPRQCTFTVYDKNFQSYSSPLVYNNYEECEKALLEYLLNNSHQL